MIHKYKKYILFQTSSHEASGGLSDITGSFDSIQEAEREARSTWTGEEYGYGENCEYFSIVDRDTWEEVSFGDWNEWVEKNFDSARNAQPEGKS